MNILLILFLGIYLAYEIQQLIQIKYFSKMKYLSAKYHSSLSKKEYSVAYRELSKLAVMNLMVSILNLIGLFSISSNFFSILIIIQLLTSFFYFSIKNKKITKLLYSIEISFSSIILILIIINFMFYNIETFKFLEKLLTIKI